MPTQVLISGSRAVIEVYEDARGRLPPWEFIQELPDSEFRKAGTRLKIIAELGLPSGEHKIKKIQANLFEIKSDQVRLLCYLRPHRVPATLVLLTAFKKKSPKLPKREIRRAEGILQEILGQGRMIT